MPSSVGENVQISDLIYSELVTYIDINVLIYAERRESTLHVFTKRL